MIKNEGENMRFRKIGRKKHRVTIILLLLLCVVLISGGILVYPYIQRGYNMYSVAVESKTIDEAIQQIRDKDNYVTYEEISQTYIKIMLKSEDRRFYFHNGFDPIATTRAMFNNIIAGRYVQGGSTLTQQLAKNMYFSFEKRIERKIAELFVVFQLENKLTKKEIIELYCNMAYFGQGCYGIQEAALHYYGVNASDLNKDQSDALAFTLKSPENYNPNVLSGHNTISWFQVSPCYF